MSKKNQNSEVAVLEAIAPAIVETPVVEAVKEPTKRELFRAQTVTLLATSNPKKKGTMSYDRFENYGTLAAGATVADALRAGVRMDDIRHDAAHGFIQVGDAPVSGREMQAGDL